MSIGNYTLANRFYCAECKTSFFIPTSSGYKKSTAVHCPICGNPRAKFTSDNWWIEKNKS